jgi:hypothetical protein
MSAVLLCTLELLPDGCKDERRRLGEVRIVRDGGDRDIGHYMVELAKSEIASRPGPWRHGRIVNFHRRMMGPYDLLLRGLIACIGGRHVTAVTCVPEDACVFDPPNDQRDVA